VAIAFRAAGARTKVDIGNSGSPQNVGLPAGHLSGDLLFMVVLTDDNNGPTTPSGWSSLFGSQPGSSQASPYIARPRMHVFYRIDNGSLGANVSVTFNTSSWPTGDPFVVACTLAYTGCDTTSPIGQWQQSNNQSTTAAQAHPQITESLANCWLLTFRGVSTDSPAATFTNSVGTDAERVDDSDGFNELAFGLYDSNVALVAGTYTQRTTTASRATTYGNVLASIAIRPAAVAGAVVAIAGTAEATGTANNVTATALSGPWDNCAVLPSYSWAIDWDGNGVFTDPGEDVRPDILSGGVTIEYGRDQSRQLSPTKIGSIGFSVNNTTRKYSPEYASGVLFGDLDPAREMKGSVVFSGTTYPLGFARIDDYNIHADRDNRTVDFTFLDGLKLLDGFPLSTPVLSSMRTGDLISYILDQAGWTGTRDIDPGATIVPFWWVEGPSALSAIQDLVRSEGPPSIAYVDLNNNFIFRDRHHRLLRSSSINVQASFAAKALGDCTAPAVTGLSFTAPFDYAHGWRDIVNSVSFDVDERSPDAEYTVVWNSDSSYSLAIGESQTIDISGSDPFINAQDLTLGTDYTVTGAGTVTTTVSRDSGQSVRITLLAIGGSVVISNLQLRGRAIPVRRTIKVSQTDAASITSHGERSYPDSAPWSNVQDAYAIATMILLHYAHRRPTVSLRLAASDPEHYQQILSRMISDRIHIVNAEMGINDDFFVETITHKIDRMNQTGKPPLHSVVLGCEKQLTLNTNPFRFDVRGSGFDQGVFDPITSDDPTTVFVFDQGMFDTDLYGT
jgi:hypothetical protein